MAVFKSFKSFKYFDYKPLRYSRIGLHVILNPNRKKNWSPATCYGPHSARISSSWSQRFNEGIKERGGRLNLHILYQGPRRHTEQTGCYKINSHSDLGFFLKVFFFWIFSKITQTTEVNFMKFATKVEQELRGRTLVQITLF